MLRAVQIFGFDTLVYIAVNWFSVDKMLGAQWVHLLYHLIVYRQ